MSSSFLQFLVGGSCAGGCWRQIRNSQAHGRRPVGLRPGGTVVDEPFPSGYTPSPIPENPIMGRPAFALTALALLFAPAAADEPGPIQPAAPETRAPLIPPETFAEAVG